MEPSPRTAGGAFYQGLLEALALGMGSARGYLAIHAPRTAVLAVALADRLDLPDVEVARIYFAAVLADMGMVGLAEEAWERPMPALPPPLRRLVEMHPIRSREGAAPIPFLELCGTLIHHHHEWWDGSGYPDGLRGESIPLGARILRLADTVAALGEPRPHRGPLAPAGIRQVVRDYSGVEFDPELAALWLSLEGTGELPALDDPGHQRTRERAVGALIPEEVSLSSSDLLLELFAALIDAKDPYTAGHSRRVALLAALVVEAMGLGAEEQMHIRCAGYLHDVGKLGVPSRILRKPGALDRQEHSRLRLHARDGAELLMGIPSLHGFADACLRHHERWDGSGYPEGIRGEAIPPVARVLAICDAYDAMTSRRAYRDALTHEVAVAELARERGGQFAPRETDAFLSLSRDVFRGVREEPAPGDFDTLALSIHGPVTVEG